MSNKLDARKSALKEGIGVKVSSATDPNHNSYPTMTKTKKNLFQIFII